MTMPPDHSLQPALPVIPDTPVARSAIPYREIVGVGALVVLADLTVYRGHGFAGLALMFVSAMSILLVASAKRRVNWQRIVVGAMTLVLAIRLLCCGSALQVLCGFMLLIAFSMCVTGRVPFIPELLVHFIRVGIGGVVGWARYLQRMSNASVVVSWLPVLSIGVPIVAIAIFSSIFGLANPDLTSTVAAQLTTLVTNAGEWFAHFSILEVFFWCFVAWLGAGLLQPYLSFRVPLPEVETKQQTMSVRAALYPAFRNTLLALIGLFVIYLGFEFATLWFREFPQGFYYAGYAHAGAAWLTFALALATITLSAIFRGSILNDPRLTTLKRLAWVWSALNMVLAIAVYNRLFIYIHFNGMTRMRMVGLFGMTAVLAGLILVVYKIARSRDFLWLLRSQLWALAFTIYFFAITPVDMLVHRYNVRCILAGDLAPSVQLTVHPISVEGLLMLRPLVECDDPIIREGVKAMLAERIANSEHRRGTDPSHWTATQLSRLLAEQQWQSLQPSVSDYNDATTRDRAIKRFADYAYQWY